MPAPVQPAVGSPETQAAPQVTFTRPPPCRRAPGTVLQRPRFTTRRGGGGLSGHRCPGPRPGDAETVLWAPPQDGPGWVSPPGTGVSGHTHLTPGRKGCGEKPQRTRGNLNQGSSVVCSSPGGATGSGRTSWTSARWSGPAVPRDLALVLPLAPPAPSALPLSATRGQTLHPAHRHRLQGDTSKGTFASNGTSFNNCVSFKFYIIFYMH